MSKQQKQGSTQFIKKSGGLNSLEKSSSLEQSSFTDLSVQGLSRPSNNAQKTIVQPAASTVDESAGYRLRSTNKSLALSITESVASLGKKQHQTLKGVAVSKRFKSFKDMTDRDPQLALTVLESRFPQPGDL